MPRVENPRRSHVGKVATTLLAALVATGCAVRNDYSATERTTSGSVNIDAGPLALRHLRVELGDDRRVGDGAPMLRGSLVNAGERDDELLRVTSPVADVVRLVGVGAGGPETVLLSAGGVARMEHPDSGWKLEGVSGDLQAATTVLVTFHFADQGRVTATVPVAG